MKREYIWLVKDRDGRTLARFIDPVTLRLWLLSNQHQNMRINRQPADPGRFDEYRSTPAEFWLQEQM